MNTSGIEPTEFNVLIRPKRLEEKTSGGIYLAEPYKDRADASQTEGLIVAVSPHAFTYEDWPEGARKPQVGDWVCLKKFAWADYQGDDGEKYWIVKDKDVLAIRPTKAAEARAA